MFQYKEKAPHVALITLKPVSNVVGGVEKVFCSMASELELLGYNVSALMFDKGVEGASDHSTDAKLINFYSKAKHSFVFQKPWSSLFTISLNKNRRWFKKINHFGQWQADCLNLVLQRLPHVDIFVCFQIEAAYILKKFLRTQIPVITMIHNHPSASVNKIVQCRDYLKQTEGIQVLIPSYISQIQTLLPDVPVYSIPNAVPKLALQMDYSRQTIVSTSRVSKSKRPDLLISASSLLKEQYQDWKFEWWGPLQDGEIYNSLLKQKNVKNYFLLPGKTTDVSSKLESASIYAFPSSSEGFPLSLTEAMAAGLPVVGCKDCEAVRTLIKDGVNGFLVDPDPQELANALERLMKSAELREKLGKQAKEDMKVYAPEVVWGMWDDLIQRVIRENQSK